MSPMGLELWMCPIRSALRPVVSRPKYPDQNCQENRLEVQGEADGESARMERDDVGDAALW